MFAHGDYYHEGLHAVCPLFTELLHTGIPILHRQDAHPEAGPDPERLLQGGIGTGRMEGRKRLILETIYMLLVSPLA